jgi:thiamine-phosphate pyrophosphorylase
VQLREKDLPAGALLALAKRLRVRIEGRALLFVNDRVDVALASEADGVQLPEDGLPVAEAYRLAGVALLVGRSVHDVEGAVAAAEAGADLLIAGTIYPSRSHPEGVVAGPALITQIRMALPRYSGLLLGIGGITKENVTEVLAAGADGVAVISALLGAPDVRQAAQELRGAMGSASPRQFEARPSL